MRHFTVAFPEPPLALQTKARPPRPQRRLHMLTTRGQYRGVVQTQGPKLQRALRKGGGVEEVGEEEEPINCKHLSLAPALLPALLPALAATLVACVLVRALWAQCAGVLCSLISSAPGASVSGH